MSDRIVAAEITPCRKPFSIRCRKSSYVSVITMREVVDIGTPIDPDSGDDLEYLGVTMDPLAPGAYIVIADELRPI